MTELKRAETKADWEKVLEDKEALAAKTMKKINDLGGWDARIDDLKLAKKRIDLRNQYGWLMMNIKDIKEIIAEL